MPKSLRLRDPFGLGGDHRAHEYARELAAIRATAEDAADRILDAAEGLLALADKEEDKKAEDAILSIVTACGFHDLVGQRVTKITETLDQVAGRLTSDDDTSDPSQG